MTKNPHLKVQNPDVTLDALLEKKNRGAVVEIDLIHYDEKTFEEKEISSIEETFPYKSKNAVTWINIEGTHETELIQKLAAHYSLHPLLIEDIIVGDQRPKLDDYEDHLFVIANMLIYDNRNQTIKIEQISFVIGGNYLISFQEQGKKGDVFDPIREKLRNYKGKIRKQGADYLLYSLIDMIVDNYFLILERVGERIEEMESKLILDPAPMKLRELYKLKREIIFLRKSVWPLREVVGKIDRDDSGLIKETAKVYIKDVYDHIIQIIDTIESFRDVLASMLDIYLSSTSNKMNSVMKVLTVISTIFMPLTFIVGIYGMNFDNMPELRWKHGYFLVLASCGLISFLMLVFFKRKRWL